MLVHGIPPVSRGRLDGLTEDDLLRLIPPITGQG